MTNRTIFEIKSVNTYPTITVCQMKKNYEKSLILHLYQCPKLRVHPAPEVHDFAVRCMDF